MNPFFFEIFEQLSRLAPGDDFYSLKALSLVELPDHKLQVLDLGCGTGIHSMMLLKQLDAHIFSVDIHKPFIDNFQKHVQFKNLQDSFTLINSDMAQLDLPKASFDLIWSEGALYNVGISNGLKICRQLLKDKGYMVFSDMNWLTPNRPTQAVEFWNKEYPQMTTVDKTIELIKENGFKFEEYLRLPIPAHTENYYRPLSDVLKKYHTEKLTSEQQQIIDEIQLEIDIYKKYKGNFGYVFYIISK